MLSAVQKHNLICATPTNLAQVAPLAAREEVQVQRNQQQHETGYAAAFALSPACVKCQHKNKV